MCFVEGVVEVLLGLCLDLEGEFCHGGCGVCGRDVWSGETAACRCCETSKVRSLLLLCEKGGKGDGGAFVRLTCLFRAVCVCICSIFLLVVICVLGL